MVTDRYHKHTALAVQNSVLFCTHDWGTSCNSQLGYASASIFADAFKHIPTPLLASAAERSFGMHACLGQISFVTGLPY